MSNLIVPGQQEEKKLLKTFVDYKERMMYMVRNEAKDIVCKKCGKKNLKVIELHEIPSPIPTSIILLCKICNFSFPFATDRFGQVKQFSDMIQEELEKKGLAKQIEDAGNAQIKQFKDPNKFGENNENPDRIKVKGVWKKNKKK